MNEVTVNENPVVVQEPLAGSDGACPTGPEAPVEGEVRFTQEDDSADKPVI